MAQEIFGGSSGSSEAQSQYTSRSRAKSKESSKTIDVTPDAYKSLRNPLATALQGIMGGNTSQLNTMLNGISPTGGGPMVAPIGANEQQVLDQLMKETAPGNERDAYLKDVLAGKYLNSNPYLDEAIRAAQRPTLQGLEETLSRELPGRFTQGGQFVQPRGSSAFDRAAAVATRGAADAIGDIATNMSFAGYEGERGRQQEAVQLSQGEVDTVLKNLEAQALPRLIQDMGIERGLEQFQVKMTSLLQALQLAGELSLNFGTKSKGKSKSKSDAQGTSSSESEQSSSNGIFGALFGGL